MASRWIVVRDSTCGAYFTGKPPPERWSEHPTDARVFASRVIAETVAENLGDEVHTHPVPG